MLEHLLTISLSKGPARQQITAVPRGEAEAEIQASTSEKVSNSIDASIDATKLNPVPFGPQATPVTSVLQSDPRREVSLPKRAGLPTSSVGSLPTQAHSRRQSESNDPKHSSKGLNGDKNNLNDTRSLNDTIRSSRSKESGANRSTCSSQKHSPGFTSSIQSALPVLDHSSNFTYYSKKAFNNTTMNQTLTENRSRNVTTSIDTWTSKTSKNNTSANKPSSVGSAKALENFHVVCCRCRLPQVATLLSSCLMCNHQICSQCSMMSDSIDDSRHIPNSSRNSRLTPSQNAGPFRS